jgi:iron-sulfur cluster assembly protein
MAITLTENAARHIASSLERRGGGLGLRLGVRQAGCSGLKYVVDFADAANPDEEVFESHGVKVLVSREHLSFLDGTEVDYAREGLSSAFRYHNPNVAGACGCGESFVTG